MKTIHRDIVSAVIFSKDNKILMGKKDSSKGGVYNDCWHIPGGGIDNGEDMITALGREVLEEVGIDISSYKAELLDDLGRGESVKTVNGEDVNCEMTFNVFRVDISDKNANEIKVMLNDDLVEYTWIPSSELSEFKLTPPSITLFTRLGML